MKKLLLLILLVYSFFLQTVSAQQELPPLSACRTSPELGTFNLNMKYADIVTILQYSANVSYHHSYAEAQNNTAPITSNLSSYVATSSSQRIYVRARHNASFQYSYYYFDLITNYPSEVGNPADLYTPSPSLIFDLTTNIPLITGGNSQLTVSFHRNQQDAGTGQNAIQSPNAYQAESQTEKIWVSVLNSAGCRNATKNFNINVTNGPVQVPSIITAYLCDNDQDGIVTYNLQDSWPQILRGLNLAEHSVSFFNTEADAISGTGALTNMNYTLDTPFLDYLFVRVTKIPTLEFSTATFLMSIKIKPTIRPLHDYVLTQRPFTGTASFNIMNHFHTVNNEQVVVEDGGAVGAHALNVKFFLTQADAIAQTNAMNDNYDLAHYTNTLNPQTIWVSATNVTDGVVGCEPAISNYQLKVVEEDADAVYIPDANFKAKLIALGYDTNSDGKIQFTEATAVTGSLGVSSSNISDLTGLEAFTNISGFSCNNNNITKVDVSHIRGGQFDFSNNPSLQYINLKNGQADACGVFLADGSDYACSMFLGCPSLRYICVDEGENTGWTLWGYPNLQLSTYCTFIPGGNFNTIAGKAIFDLNNNGCNAQNSPRPFVKMKINDGTNNGSVFTNATADYTFYTGSGNFTITPEIENPTFFNINQANAIVNFPLVNNSVATNNFCLSANGVHPDLEIVVAPAIPARPGFEAVYKIVYKNKGNQTLSQNYGIGFFYNQHLASFVSATVAPETQVPGSLSWSYADLKPFESRSFYVTLRINTPTEANPVNIDDVLTFTASIMPTAGDENSGDNLFVYNQTVVGSFDPNDIECLQGDIVPPSEIGKYLHYMIRFENTGNYRAENIVVKDIIDTTKYDISSLQVLGTSHPVDARVKGNIAEFIFKSVNLDSGGHGNVLLKLKSKANLTTGDEVSKKVSIFFDYNAPINTNNANTIFQTLSVGEHNLDNSVKMYPNPANEFVKIEASSNINSLEFYDVHGRILMISLINDNSASLDLSKYSTGIYYVKIKTDKGYKVEKLIKK